MFADTLPESIIKGLSIRAKELGAVNLGQGIPSFPTAPHIIAAASVALSDPGIGVYPNFLGEIQLREAIARKLGRETNNILITVGAMEATASAIFAVIETGDRVGIVTPDYCNHVPQILLARGVPVEIPMKEEKRWAIDFDRLEWEAKEGLKVLIVTNPNNPTGALFSKHDLDRLIRLAVSYDFWILSDETYGYLTYEHSFVSMLEYWNQHEKLLVVRSFSKEYAMTGWRVGYVVAREELIRAMAKVHDALTGCVPKISQRAALAAITGSQDIVGKYQHRLKERRDLAYLLLSEIPDMVTIKPEGAYYIFPKVQRLGIDFSEKLLVEGKVAVVPGEAFGKGGEGHIRISFAVEPDILKDGIARLATYLSGV